jgi:hypothetical protein
MPTATVLSKPSRPADQDGSSLRDGLGIVITHSKITLKLQNVTQSLGLGFAKYYTIGENETDEPCITNMRDKKYTQNFSRKSWIDETTWEI